MTPRAYLEKQLSRGGVDLHLHTTVSDGELCREQVVELARDYSLNVFSITDHDAVDAYHQIPPDGKWLFSGVELDTDAGGGFSPEVLGYGFDVRNPRLVESLREIQRLRRRRALALMERVNHALEQRGITEPALSRKDLLVPGRATLLKPHLYRPLVSKGLFRSEDQARRFLNEQVEDVAIAKPSPEEAIELLHQAGGISVLAHPGYYDNEVPLAPFVEQLVDAGLDGLEGNYPYFRGNAGFESLEKEQAVNARVSKLARAHGLLLTRGSDSHTLTHWQIRNTRPF